MAYKDQREIPVGSIPKIDETTIETKLVIRGDNFNFDLREFIQNERYTGPTKKGLRLYSENFENFKELIMKIEVALNSI